MRRHAKASSAGSKPHLANRLGLTVALALVISSCLGVSVALADAPPSVSVNPATPSYTRAHLSGDVNPNGGPSSTAWELQYSKGSEGPWSFANGGVLEGTDPETEVEADITGLGQSATYFFRLIVINEDGANQVIKAGPSFATLEVTPPTVSIDPVSELTATSVRFNGDVNPNAPEAEPATPGIEEAFATNYRFQCTPACPGLSGTVAADNSSHEVTANATSLQPGTEYQVSLVAKNGGPRNVDPKTPSDPPAAGPPETVAGPVTFTTPPVAPTIVSGSVSNVSATNVTLNAQIRPGGAATTYHFEYATKQQFDEAGFTAATSTPESAPIGSDNTAHAVSAEVDSLSPDNHYRYRVVATNAVEETTSDIFAFKTTAPDSNSNLGQYPGQGFLPNDRAWEMVSTPGKNGGEVMPHPFRTRAAGDGSALLFTSLQAFGEIEGGAASFEYIAQRSSDPDPGDNGWSTKGISPRMEPVGAGSGLLGTEPRFRGAAPGDLSAGVLSTIEPLTEEPYVEEAPKLYLREGLRGSGTPTYRLITECPFCREVNMVLPSATQVFPPVFAGASDDFQHVVFESRLRLTADAGFGPPKLYQWDDGSLSLAGILPSGEAASNSIALDGASIPFITRNITPHAISADGSRTFFTVEKNGSVITGALYARVNGRSTFQVNASELASPEAPQPARYGPPAADHSRAFFTTSERLTEDASSGGGLYMWERADSDEEQSIAVDAEGGTFTLAFHGVSTEPIAFDAPASSVQSALESLKGPAPEERPLIVAGNIDVSGGPGSLGASSPYEVTFTGDFAGVNVAELSPDGSALSGGAASATVTTTSPVSNLTLLSVDGEPADGLGGEIWGVIGTSEDGRYVYFVSNGQLVAGAPPLGGGRTGIYLWHEGTVSFVGESSEFSFTALDFPFYAAELSQHLPQATVAGHNLLVHTDSGKGMLSAHGGIDADHGSCSEGTGSGCQQLYLYKADSEELACVSCNPSGAPTTADASTRVEDRSSRGATLITSYYSRALSDDGRYSFFTTAERLVDEDFNGVRDAYVYDSIARKPYLLSSGEDKYPSYFIDASADGRDVFIGTREQLSGWDVDGAYDVYDARVGGGFPEPPPAPPSCTGDACQPPPLALNDPTPASSSFLGSGNPKQTRASRCGKGQRKAKARGGKTRCVKKKGNQQKRNANSNRRAGR